MLIKVLVLILVICNPTFGADKVISKDPGPAEWANWAGWSPCTKSCGFGNHFRVRTCSDPSAKPANPGCKGQNEEAAFCYSGPCLGPEVKGVVFNKDSYQNYTAHDIPTRYLVLYIHFKPLISDATLIHRYRDCNDDKCEHEVEVKLVRNRIVLKIYDGGFGHVSVTTENTIRMGEWQTLLVQITRRKVIVRLDDRKRMTTKLPVVDTTELNFDAIMIVGANRFLKEGFIGTVLKLRLNFKDLSLFHSPEWIGFGAPVKQRDITLEKTDSSEIHSRFLGKYSAKMIFKKMDVLLIKMSVYLMGTEGLLAFNHGTVPGSFVSLTLHRGAIRFCLSLGNKPNCQKAVLLQIRKWYYISVMVTKTRGELRVDKGKAVQVQSTGRHYQSKPVLLLGGGEKQDWEVISRLTTVDEGFDGVVDEVFVNGKVLPYKHAVLVDVNGRVNSDGYSLSAHVSEVYETPSSKVSLRCDATLFARRGGVVTSDWIESDMFITNGEGEKIISQVPGNQYESALILQPDHHHEGIYACIVNHDGFRIITHTFPVLRHSVSVREFSKLVRAAIVLVPLIAITSTCIICVCCCCKCSKCSKCCQGNDKKSTPPSSSKLNMSYQRPLPEIVPLLPDRKTSLLLDRIETGLSQNRNINRSPTMGLRKSFDKLYPRNDVEENIYMSPEESPQESPRREESESDSESSQSEENDNTKTEKDEILEKAERVLSLIGSIDNLKTVVSRLSQEQTATANYVQNTENVPSPFENIPSFLPSDETYNLPDTMPPGFDDYDSVYIPSTGSNIPINGPPAPPGPPSQPPQGFPNSRGPSVDNFSSNGPPAPPSLSNFPAPPGPPSPPPQEFPNSRGPSVDNFSSNGPPGPYTSTPQGFPNSRGPSVDNFSSSGPPAPPSLSNLPAPPGPPSPPPQGFPNSPGPSTDNFVPPPRISQEALFN